MVDQIVLYDLPGRQKGADKLSTFSFNVTKIRMVLNYRQIPYTTEWVEYPDLEPRFKALWVSSITQRTFLSITKSDSLTSDLNSGIPPNDPGTGWTDYTAPAFRLPDGQYIMNSAKIIPELERIKAEPPLHLEANLHQPLEGAVNNLAATMWWNTLARLPKDVLNPRSAEYYEKSRAKNFGAPLDEVAAQKGGPAAWEAAKAPAKKLAQLMKDSKKDDGPFVLGSEPSYGDFIVAAVFEGVERCHRGEYEKLMELDASFPALHGACRP